MQNYINFRTKPYRNLILKINPQAEFNLILETLNAATFPAVAASDEHINYAVLELVNNSIRAHREHRRAQPIVLSYHAVPAGLIVRIRDWGKGFDVTRLPFPLDEPIEKIDFSGKQFIEYRKKNNFKKFGMGICIVRQTFSRFAIRFFDDAEKETQGTSATCAGTEMEMFIETAVNDDQGDN